MSMIDKARSWLFSRGDKPAKTDSVKVDDFDEMVWEEILEAAPSLRELVTDADEAVGNGNDLVRDTFMELFQSEPEVRNSGEMKPTHLPNHAAAQALIGSTEVRDAREITKHDEYGAAMAALSVAQTAKTEVAKYRKAIEEAADDAEKAEKEADEAADSLPGLITLAEDGDEAAANAADDAAAAAAAAAAAPDDEDLARMAQEAQERAEEALRNAQQKQDDLRRALEKAQEQEAKAGQAGQALDNATQQAARNMQSKMDQAVKEAAEERANENAMLASLAGLGPGDIKRLSFQERAEYAEMLKSSRMADFRKLIGQMRANFKAARRERTVIGRDHMIGVIQGGITDIIEEELAALAHPVTRLDLFQRISTEQALNFDYQGKEKIGDGAIICCIDNSGSMNAGMGGPCVCGRPSSGGYSASRCACGVMPLTREAWAKALALALLDSARQSGRDFVGINFSSSWGSNKAAYTVHRFPGGRGDLKDVVAFAEEFLNGGTEFEPPLLESLRIMESDFKDKNRAKADIVFITDDDCSITEQWVKQHITPAKERLGFKVWGIAIGTDVRQSGAMSVFCDDVRSVTDFANTEQASDIARSIQ